MVVLLDTEAMGHDSASASRLLLERGKVAATPMHGWGASEIAISSFASSSAMNRRAAR